MYKPPLPIAGFATERDRRIFKFLFDCKVASLRQLKTRFFKDATLTAASRRMMRLYRAGWLDRSAHFDERRMHIDFSLSERAYRDYVLCPGVNDRRVQLKSDKVQHDEGLVDIRELLEKRSSVKRFYAENELQSNYDLANSKEFMDSVNLHSDAVLEVLSGEHRRYLVPLEYEGSAKAMDRWESKLLDYYLKHDAEAVLWVCETDAIVRKLGEIDMGLSTGYEPKMYFATITNVQQASEELNFFNSKKDKRITL